MTVSAFARRHGVSRQAVQGWIRRGHVTPLPDGRIEAAVADRQVRDSVNRDLARGPRSRRTRSGRAPAVPSLVSYPSRAESERRLAYHKAETARIASEEQAGRLLDRAETERVAFALYRAVRDRLLTIPNRTAPVVAGISEIAACHATIRDEIEKALEELSEGILPPKPRPTRTRS